MVIIIKQQNLWFDFEKLQLKVTQDFTNSVCYDNQNTQRCTMLSRRPDCLQTKSWHCDISADRALYLFISPWFICKIHCRVAAELLIGWEL